MIVRLLDQQENIKTRELYEEVFYEDSKGFVDYYYSEKIKDNKIYVVEEDGQICAMLHLNPYVMMFMGNECKSYYIVAVATKKEYRKRGYMKCLLTKALSDMYEEGLLFTYLMPAAEAIYSPYDFCTVYRQEKLPENPGCMEEIAGKQYVTENDLEEISFIAQRHHLSRYQLFAKRDYHYYERLLKEISCENGKIHCIKENDKIKDVWVNLAEKQPDERPKIMMRIIDVRRMFMSLKVRMLMAACFTITDPWIEQNNRCLNLFGTEFSGLMLMDADEKNSEGTIPIAALTLFLFGAITVEELDRMEDVFLTERLKGELSKIIPVSKISLDETV